MSTKRQQSKGRRPQIKKQHQGKRSLAMDGVDYKKSYDGVVGLKCPKCHGAIQHGEAVKILRFTVWHITCGGMK